MKLKLLVLSSFFTCMSFSVLKAQLAMPYTSGFDNAQQQSGWLELRKGTSFAVEQWGFSTQSAYSGSSLQHLYPVGGTQVTDDWFISPAFNISAGGALDSLRYSFGGFGMPQTGDTVFIYLLNGSVDPALATSVTILKEFSGSNYQNDYEWRSLAPIALPAKTGNSYIAFRYKTINNWLDVRFDNIGISRISTAGIGETATVNAEIFPNPAIGNQVNVKFDAEKLSEPFLTFDLYNTAGQIVHSAKVAGNHPVDLPVAPGFYAYKLHGTATVAEGKLIVR